MLHNPPECITLPELLLISIACNDERMSDDEVKRTSLGPGPAAEGGSKGRFWDEEEGCGRPTGGPLGGAHQKRVLGENATVEETIRIPKAKNEVYLLGERDPNRKAPSKKCRNSTTCDVSNIEVSDSNFDQ